jgi:hypothetical protein
MNTTVIFVGDLSAYGYAQLQRALAKSLIVSAPKSVVAELGKAQGID